MFFCVCFIGCQQLFIVYPDTTIKLCLKVLSVFLNFEGSSFIVVLFELLYNVINWLEIVFLLFWVKLCRASVEGIFIFIEQGVDTFLTKSQDVGQDYSERWKSLKSWWVKMFKIYYDFKNSCNMILEMFDTHNTIV